LSADDEERFAWVQQHSQQSKDNGQQVTEDASEQSKDGENQVAEEEPGVIREKSFVWRLAREKAHTQQPG